VTDRAREQAYEVGGMSTRVSISSTILGWRWLLLARASWVIIATLTMGLSVASIPSYVIYVLELDQAVWMEAPVEAPTALVFALNVLGVLASITAVLVCLTLAVVLFQRRSEAGWSCLSRRTFLYTRQCWPAL
jgi:hypothetical protein